ncbi:glycosyltransferase family 4 protein [Sinorhizobium chiapasense]|uniref:Glycosyltransferase family 4 protein n=1 Tax=Sinorhizobium chiapasense TaxID=501572 RepID=A0ABZ2BHL3_9HYPH
MSAVSTRRRVLVQLNSAGIGGTEFNAVDLAAGVVEHGYDSILVAPKDTFRPGPSLLEVAKERGFDIELFDRPQSTFEGARTMRHLADKHRVDVVHVYGSWSQRPAYWGPCFLGLRPLVMTIYEMKVNADTAGAGMELIIGTGYLLDGIQGRRGGVHLISPPVDLERDTPNAVDDAPFLARYRIRNDLPRVVIVSRLDNDLKALSVELAMRACSQLADTGVQLIIVGRGNAEDRLLAMASAINAARGRPIVHMVGPLADPRPAYACADIVVGMGGSAARGLAFGKPLIVAGEFGWFKTFAPDTEAALFRNSFWSDVISPQPVADLVQALEALLCSPEKRINLGRRGRIFAAQNFGLKQMSAKLAQVYSRALETYGPRHWLSDIPLELGFLGRRFTSRRGYRPLMLHSPPVQSRHL